jgi:ferredoxin
MYSTIVMVLMSRFSILANKRHKGYRIPYRSHNTTTLTNNLQHATNSHKTDSSYEYKTTMMHPFLILLLLPSAWGFISPHCSNRLAATSTTRLMYQSEEIHQIDDHLLDIAKKLKLEVFDLDDGVYGLDVSDHSFGLEVVQATLSIHNDGNLGIHLKQVAGSNDGRGLVFIADTTEPILHIGDVITGVMTTDKKYKENTAGMNYDRLVEVINEAKDASKDHRLLIEVNRLVERAKVQVEVDLGDGDTKTINALAGENLRTILIRKQVKLYDPETKRFDQPFACGDCAGEGICGTCLVAIKEGNDALNEKSGLEEYITRGRPSNWRAACQATVGPDNKEGKVRLQLHPQSGFQDELNPGVRNVHP